ncbi:hypothetical protein BCR32DRAFT_331045 [Anaeromyces robustus]|uniref:Phosphoglycerate mutase-like protein n=1 Tax=Anaeromyces robustus TaxID=1754192 RepID=A0A1Y1UV25_9FUNG|nr:hypothetical protein BCR32DRAFT_331045 [Anaeromyces robustus]|eukprot:ORX41478.1 hypothetical protein BCR32DRAFT_331045 [Anaeromyces robustus]
MRVKYIINTLLGITLANAKLIMLIRHGEKINDDYTDLSPEGQARAECLIETFGTNDTVIPLSKSLGQQVDLSFTSGKFKDLAQYIYSSPEEVILVSWGNDRIPKIAKQLGITNAPEWKGKVFDDVWILTDGKTPYLKNSSVNNNPTRSFTGTKGLNMYIHKENVEQCMRQRLSGNTSSTPVGTAGTAGTTGTTGITGNTNGNIGGATGNTNTVGNGNLGTVEQTVNDPQLSTNNSTITGNNTISEGQNTDQNLQNSGSSMIKVSTVTLVTLLSTLLYHLY